MDISRGLTTLVGNTKTQLVQLLSKEVEARKAAVFSEHGERVKSLAEVTKSVAADMVAIRGKIDIDVSEARQAAEKSLQEAVQNERAARIDNDLSITSTLVR